MKRTTVRQNLIAAIKRDVAAIVRRDPGDANYELSGKLFTRLDHIENALGWTRTNREVDWMTCREIGRRIVVIAESILVDQADLEDAAHFATFVRHVDNYAGKRIGEGLSWQGAHDLANETIAKAGALDSYRARHGSDEDADVEEAA